MKNQPKKANTQRELFDRIIEKLPDHLPLVDAVSNCLGISPDAAYRRIRSDKILNLNEITVLCRKFNVSVDGLLDISSGLPDLNNGADGVPLAHLRANRIPAVRDGDGIGYSLPRSAETNKRRAVLTLTGLLFLRPEDIVFCSYAEASRAWQLTLTDRSVHRLRMNSTAKGILSLDNRLVQISQRIILNTDYLLLIENGSLRCLLVAPYSDLEFRASRRYFVRMRETLGIL